MKKRTDSRHKKRIKQMQQLFSASFVNKIMKLKKTRHRGRVGQISQSKSKIDKFISASAPQFPIDKIAKLDVAILRLAVYELLVEKKQPPKVIIDEAIEIAKEYGGDSSPGFVNGVLGTIYNKLYG